MFLKSLESQGFKSFPDKTTLNFEKGITGIVGPNGSGKSNVSDAIRWVLGEQSNKQLRGEKSEDVIFNGTSSRRPQGMAQVTLCLDNTDRSLNCDTDEVFITRRFYRSGESEYQINHATVRLKDINELFMDTGLGRDGYSMIGQGKISDIVSRRSDDRREMFEEAAGISRFRYRKTEAERKLTAAEDNLVRLRDIMKELTDRVGPLEDQCIRAKKFLSLSGEEKTLEVGLWLINLRKFKDKLREQERKIDLAQSQYDKTRDRIEEIIDELDRSGSQTRILTVQMDQLRRAVSESEECVARIEGQIAVCENNIFHNNENINRLNEEIKNGGNKGDSLDEELKQKQQLMDEKLNEIQKNRSALENSAAQLETLLRDTEESSKQLDALRTEMALINENLSEYNLKNVTAVSSLSEIENRGGVINDSVSQREKQLEDAELEKKALLSDLENCEEKISECSNAIKGAEMLASSSRSKLDTLNEEIQKLTLEHQTKLRRSQILIDMEKSLDGFNNTVKTVMKESEKGHIAGVKGVISRLISVDEKYSAAIEVALGGAIQNIVIATESDGKKALNYLKANRIGRATFLPMDVIKGRSIDISKVKDYAGFLGSADLLVSCKPEYKNIVSFLLGGIAVAEDIDCATAIARKSGYRFRVVTLDGQVVNTGGSLTGGSFSKSAGLLSRSSEIEKLKADADKLEKEILFKKADAEKLRIGLDSRMAYIEATKAEQITANEDKIRVLSEIKRVSNDIDSISTALNELRCERDNAEIRIAELKKSASDAEQMTIELQQKLEQSEQKLSTLVSSQDSLSEQREKLLMENSAVRVTILSLENEANGIKLDISSIENRRIDAEKATETTKQRINELVIQNENEQNQIEEYKNQITELCNKSDLNKQKSAEKLKERTDLETKISALTSEERDLSAQKERLGGENVRLRERRDAMTKEYDDIISKMFDKYELTITAAEELGIEIEDVSQAGNRLREIKAKIKSLGSINLAAIDEYSEVSQRYEFMKTQIADVENAKQELERLINELIGNMQTAFNEKFALINRNFSETFVELFGGGTAHLSLSNPEDVLNSGIEIKVQPPGKNVSTIEQLSGGEKSIVALAIYFAMMKVAPPPFCMLDEVESALDDVNVDRFAGYLRRMCKNTQFIVVTHRRGTMEEADVLYGITMQEKGVSKILKLEGKEY